MKVISFANRLVRDLAVKSITELTADVRQELLDAMNGAIQKFHDLSPDHAKTGVVSIALEAPSRVTLEVTNGSYEIGTTVFPVSSFYRSLWIDGDEIRNQIAGESTLTHPYSGPSGTVEATVYCDAVAIPEEFAEITSNPYNLDTDTCLLPATAGTFPRMVRTQNVCRPDYWWMEANAGNKKPPGGPMVMRFSSLPDRAYRLRCDAILAPPRIKFEDILTNHVKVPIRDEHVEAYLLPVARAILTESSVWEDKETISRVNSKGSDAEERYLMMVPQYPSTPDHRVGTRRGF